MKIQDKTKSSHNVNIAQQHKSISKTTTPINFQFIEKNQQKAYMTAKRLVETLGYNHLDSF